MNCLQIIKRDLFVRIIQSSIYVLIGLWMLFRFFDLTPYIYTYQTLFSFQKKFSDLLFVLFVGFFFFNWYKKSRDYFLLCSCIVFIIFSFILKKYANTTFAFDLFFIPLFLCRFLDKNCFYKSVLFAIFIFVIITILSYEFGLLKSAITFYRAKEIRYTLGFSHPNGLGLFAFLIAIYLSLYKDKVNFIYLFVFLALSYFCYKVPNSITSTVVIVVLAFCCICGNYLINFKISSRSNKVLLVFLLSLFVVFVILIYYVAFTFSFRDILKNFPGEIWARFELGNKAFNVYGVSLFGKFNEIYADFIKFPNKADWWLWVDCTYFYLPLYNGILASIFFLGMLFMTIARAVRNFEYKFVLIFFVVILYGISESSVITAVFMPVFAYPFFKQLNNRA